MYKKNKVLVIIPARSGSKGIKNKNIKIVKKKPLLAHSIIYAKKCKFIDKIVVSTDSYKYANIAKNLKQRFLF
jgi:CMP-N,N'-diacetyllegionaminic acid synthase